MNNFQIPYLRFLIVGSLVLLTSLNNSATAQKASILQDAIELSRLMVDAPDSETQDYYLIKRDSIASVKAYEILRAYTGSPGAINPATINSEFEGNPFLGLEVDSISYLNITPYKNSELEVASPNQADINLARISSLPITPIATGLADFLVKRTKEELNIAFFNRLKKYLDGQEEAEYMFPKTKGYLGLIGDQIYNWDKYLESLQVSFQKDLNELPRNLANYIENSTRMRSLADSGLVSQNKINLVSSFLLAGSGIINQNLTPVEVINLIANEIDSTLNGNYFNLLNQLTYESFWDQEAKDFLPKSSILKLQDKKVWLAYLGLLYQRINSYSIGGINIGNSIKTNRERILSTPNNFLKSISSLKGLAKDWNKFTDWENRDNLKYGAQMANIVHQFISSGVGFAGIFIPNANVSDFTEFIDFFTSLTEIVIDISAGNYSYAVMVSSKLIQSMSMDSCSSLDCNGLVASLKMHCKNKQEECSKIKKASEKFLYFGSFIAGIVEANNSEEVSQLLDAYALPAGSSSVKKNVAFSISINSYVGAFLGKESYSISPGSSAPNTSYTYGITAPVGLGFNFGLPNRIGSLSVYGSIIDLGALVSYGFQTDSLSNVDEVTIGDILAPGLYGVYGLGWNIPLSIGAGYQIGPQLRNITVGGISERIELNGRCSVFVAVDIPIFHLLNVPRKKLRP